jgi:hypothetical protein
VRVQLRLFTVAAAGAGFALVLYAYNPAAWPYGPVCLFHALTGLYCPGCGGLRAAHHMLHGEIAESVRYNPIVLVLPFLLATAVLDRGRRGKDWARMLVLGPVLAFGVLRNFPLDVFDVLRPSG